MLSVRNAVLIAVSVFVLSIAANAVSLMGPPDSGGAVGPTQILVQANGRIKVFDKLGNVGHDVTEMVKKYPIQALLVGFGVGLLLGRVSRA